MHPRELRTIKILLEEAEEDLGNSVKPLTLRLS
jgi:hypothetical protein